MNPTHPVKVPTHLNESVLQAIHGALEEEKASKLSRSLKTFGATLICSAVLGIPFLLSFKDQLNWSWGLGWGIWTLILLFGFSLHFYPQPRLMVSGVWSPFVLGRILLIAAATTVFQILICPSFVFLSSPFAWNPLVPVTDVLMRIGGMNLCMLFCGFFFSFVASLLSLSFVIKVTKSRNIKNAIPALGVLILAQVPVLAVQALSEDLQGYVISWVIGLALGCITALIMIRLANRLKISEIIRQIS